METQGFHRTPANPLHQPNTELPRPVQNQGGFQRSLSLREIKYCLKAKSFHRFPEQQARCSCTPEVHFSRLIRKVTLVSLIAGKARTDFTGSLNPKPPPPHQSQPIFPSANTLHACYNTAQRSRRCQSRRIHSAVQGLLTLSGNLQLEYI